MEHAQQYMATESAVGGQRYLTGNTCPGWEITRFVSSAKRFNTEKEAADAADFWNQLGHSFKAVPAQVLA